MPFLLTIGEILVEIMATTKGEGFREPQPLVGPFPSGAPAIFIDQVGRLGHPCGIASAVGDDDFGRLNLDRLTRDGVDVSAVAVHRDIATGSAFVRYRPDGSRDFVYNIAGSANGRIGRTPEAERLIERADHLHVMGTALSIPGLAALTELAIEAVRARGGTISFDPNVRKELLADPAVRAALQGMLARAHVFLPSGDEILAFADAADEEDAARRLLARGVREIVLKRGAAGSSHFDADGRTDSRGFEVEEVDPTGAGDCFSATFLVCRSMGMPPHRALAYANAAGARTVSIKGPMEGAATFAELDAFIAKSTVAAAGGSP
jgi:sugar/nucleoside kinase (ribokinase family)